MEMRRFGIFFLYLIFFSPFFKSEENVYLNADETNRVEKNRLIIEIKEKELE